jgi:RNA polymerase sigma factor (sigma-70 family)
MAARPQHRPVMPRGAQRQQLSPEASAFYAAVWKSARAGCINLLRTQGCDESQAEEIFAEAFAEVMQTKDPIKRKFVEAQMVNLLKMVCSRRLIDYRRHHGLIKQVALTDVGAVGDDRLDTPEELVERMEAVEVGREALLALPRRDRLVFRMRYQMDLKPEEIIRNIPGLSLRTYRKLIQRANSRVLAAYERIDTGERCEEMESQLLRRFISQQSDGDERELVEAHLTHCRACQQACIRMRGYLHDVGSTVALAATAGGLHARLGATSHALDLLAHGGESLAAATRTGRERLRDLLMRVPGVLPGGGGDGATGQLFGMSGSQLGLCGGVVGVAACAAVGVSLTVHSHHRSIAPVRHAVPAADVQQQTPTSSPHPIGEGRHGASKATKSASRRNRPKRSKPSPPTSYSAKDAKVSGEQTGREVGVQGEGVGTPLPAEPLPQYPSGGSSGGSSGGGGSGEFGM